MMALDLFWTTNPDWYEDAINNSGQHYDRLKPTAPRKAKESYDNYLKQIRRAAAFEARTGAHLI